jgi:hypothetical protein
MPSNLPADIETGQLNACLIRAAKLDTDCTVLGGNASGYVTIGLATFTATPDIKEGTKYEPENADGEIFYTYERDDKYKRWTLAGELLVFDWEGMELLFGGSLILGAVGGDFAGKVIGHNAPGVTAANRNGIYLEVISRIVGRGAGDCVTSGGGIPTYAGTIFPKAKLTMGERTFEQDAARMRFTGVSTNNPVLYNGPWNDYPGAGYIDGASGKIQVGYATDEYEAILATAGAGYVDLPVGS